MSCDWSSAVLSRRWDEDVGSHDQRNCEKFSAKKHGVFAENKNTAI